MSERTNQDQELQEEAKILGRKYKGITTQRFNTELPKPPTFQVRGKKIDILDAVNQQSGLILASSPNYGWEYSVFTRPGTHVSYEPITVLTSEGIYKVPMIAASIATHTVRLVANWEKELKY